MGKIERLNSRNNGGGVVRDKINELVDAVNSLPTNCDSKDFPECRERLAKEPEKPEPPIDCNCKRPTYDISGYCQKCGGYLDSHPNHKSNYAVTHKIEMDKMWNEPKPSPEKPACRCPKCGDSHELIPETPKPSPTSLDEALRTFEHINGGVLCQTNNKMEKLVNYLKQFIRGEIEQCLTENDSSTHIIAKDLYEKLGIQSA